MINKQYAMAKWLEHLYNIHSVNLIKEQYLMAGWLEHPYHIQSGNNDKGSVRDGWVVRAPI